jgi:hypothetical protein
MRMSNDRDQALLRSAVSDSAANLFAFVPSLGTREALAFGVGVPLPTRLTFTDMPQEFLPQSETFATDLAMQTNGQDLNFIASVVDRWRGATMSQKPGTGDTGPDAGPVMGSETASPDPNRISLLRKPLAERPAQYGAMRTPAPAPAAPPLPSSRWPGR